MDETGKKKFRIRMPHAFVLIFIIVLICCLLTYVVPAGKYDMVDVNGRSVVDPASFHYVERTPVGLWGAIMAIPQGLVKQAGLIFMIIVIGGAIEIINKTGALEASIGRLAYRFRNNTAIVIPLLFLVFVLMGAIGVSNAIVAFVPLGLLLANNLGADALIGVALVVVGNNIGFTGGAFLSITTGFAQDIIGLPAFSGWGYRLIVTIVLYAAGAFFMVRYTKKIKRDRTLSPIHDLPECAIDEDRSNVPELDKRRIMVLIVFLIGLGFIIYGAIKSWSVNDKIPAAFFATGVACGLVYGFKINEIANYFVEGCKKLTYGGLIVGVSAAIGIVLTNGSIIHTIVHALSMLMIGLPKIIAGEMMYLANIVVNTFITSGSGQAAAVIPIFSPVGDVIGITQQSVVLAYQFGDGFTNVLLPMSSTTMAGIAMARVPFDRWIKFIVKWVLMNVIIGAIFMAIAVIINLGPF